MENHSHAVVQAADLPRVMADLKKLLQGIRFRDRRTGNGQNADGRRGVRGSDAEYWWRNVRETVRFAAGVEALIDSGCRIFLELSAHPVLGAAVHECLSNRGERGTVLASLVRDTDDQTAALTALGALHSLGHPGPWPALFPHGAQFVAVPRYPWQRERFWAEPELSRELRLKGPAHPLLDRRVHTADPCWEVKLDRRIFPYLADHRVQGRAVFPAAGFIEVALAAAREVFGTGACALENVDFLKALFLPETDERPALQITYYAGDSSFIIASRPHDGTTAWTIHVTGKMRALPEAIPPSPIDLAAARNRCATELPSDEFYRVLYDGGLQYGPAFRGVEHIWRREREMVARLKLPERIAAEAARYLVHPAYLDACIQAGFAALPARHYNDQSGVFLPVHVDCVRLFSRPETEGWVHGMINEIGPRACFADFNMVDQTGAVALELTGCRWLLVEGTGRELDDWLFEPQWHLAPLANAAPPAHPLAFFPTPQRLAKTLAAEVTRLAPPTRVPKHRREAEEELAALCAEYILRALQQCGWKPRRGERVTIAGWMKRLRLAAPAEPLLAHLINQLARAGVVQAVAGRAGSWTVVRIPRRFDTAESWQSILRRAPALIAELTLVARFGENLARLLRGEAEVAEILSPGGSTAMLDHVAADSSLFRATHRLLEKAVAESIRRIPEGRRLRVLELGAGTGAATARILPRLRADRVDYLVTDPSAPLLAAAQRELQDFHFARFQPLDFRLDPTTQGVEAGSADLVIASNALDDVADVPSALKHIRSLLAPGGVLLLSTLHRSPAWFDFVFAMRHAEGSDRDESEWQRLLSDCEFCDSAALAAGPQMLLIARAAEVTSPSASVEVSAPQERRRWMLVADAAGCAETLADRLRARGDECLVVPRTSAVDRGERIRSAWREFARCPGTAAAIHLSSLDATAADDLDVDALSAAQDSGCLSALHLVQAMTAPDAPEASALWFVTRGAQAAGEVAHPISVAQAPLIGLARVIRTEQPNLRCRVVDLSPAGGPQEIDRLVAELVADENEEEIALRGEARYVQRLVRGSLQETRPGARHFVDLHRRPCRLEISKPGVLDRLALQPITHRRPGPEEVEIEVFAAGLNFRDVMKALGIYPTEAEDATLLGDECSGRIVAVGRNVRGFRVGEEVMAIAPGCFASHVTIHAALVLPKPKQLSFEDAATMLIAYLTACYALHHLARLRKGERVLIHAAAGGVGFAAVRVAQEAGAEVFATAGSAEKRDFLRACGVRHVMDSRTLAFADEVMAITGGEGVDVVLNSLAGAAIPKSLSVLGSCGRFLEIGKRDIYQDSKIGLRPFRKNLSFFAVDLSRAMHPDFIREFSGGLRRQFDTRRLSPLPYRTFPIGDAVSAFRYMAQARQIGKVVLTMRGEEVALAARRDQTRSEFTSHCTYLVTGGTSGFGLATASWLAVKGARHLVLMSRSGAGTDEARDLIRRMRENGVTVRIARGDVSRPGDVRRVLRQIDRRMPPLRGIVHAAMVIDDGMLLQLDEERFRTVLAPKMRGAWNLHHLTLERPLDFFVLYSSAAAVMGNPGQGNYSAANAFLDALAHHRHALGRPALSVNWGFLTETGFVARMPKLQEHFARLGWTGMTPRRALHQLSRLLPTDLAQMMVARIDWSAVPARIASAPRFSVLMREVGDGAAERNDAAWIREVVMNVPPAEGRRIIENYLREQIAKVLRIPPAKISVDRPLTELGLDSLMAVELVNRVESQLGTAVPTGRLIGAPTIARISAVVLEMLTGAAADSAKEEPSAGSAVVDFAADVALDPDLRFDAAAARPAQFAEPRAIFLTGATSFPGAFLLRDLLATTQADIHCLVTAAGVEDGWEQIEAALKVAGAEGDRTRIVPVLGNLAELRFGLADSRFAELAAQIDAIHHAGAEVQHLVPYAQLKAVNVDAIQSILRLATVARRKPVHYLSSVAVFMAASVGAASAVHEDDPLANAQLLTNGYAQSRWVAEKILELGRLRGLPVNIYRPGLVPGDTATGSSASADAFWRMVRGCVEIGCGPDSDVNLFLTPVDYVTGALTALSRDPQCASRTFHLVNPRPVSFAAVLKAAREFGYPLDLVTREAWEGKVRAAAARHDAGAFLPYLLLIPGEYHDPMRQLTAVPAVAVRRTLSALAGKGVECPRIDRRFLARCFAYLAQRGELPSPRAAVVRRRS